LTAYDAAAVWPGPSTAAGWMCSCSSASLKPRRTRDMKIAAADVIAKKNRKASTVACTRIRR
jgi:hypothetical protein